MPNDPERPIEKLLRAGAEKRRRETGAPFDLHPVDRNIFQGEVARVFGRESSGRRLRAPSARPFWPRLGWGLAGLVAVGLAAKLMWPSPGRNGFIGQLAKNEKEPIRQKVASPPVALRVESPVAAPGAAAESAAALTLADQSAAPAGTLFIRQSVPLLETTQTREMQSVDQLRAKGIFAGAALTKSAVAPALLSSFRVEQSGQEIRVIDQDGSVYTGNLELAQALPALGAARSAIPPSQRTLRESLETQKRRPDATSNLPAPSPPSYFFSVAGTNLSLNQRVIFTGELLPLATAFEAQPPSRDRLTNTLARRATTTSSPPARGLPALPGCRILGRAVAGNGAGIPIDALPVK